MTNYKEALRFDETEGKYLPFTVSKYAVYKNEPKNRFYCACCNKNTKKEKAQLSVYIKSVKSNSDRDSSSISGLAYYICDDCFLKEQKTLDKRIKIYRAKS